MKKLLLFTSVIIAGTLTAQTTIYSENFGVGQANNPLVNVYNGYQNTNITYSGNADIRTTTPSEGYTNASGSGCVFIGAVTANPEKYLLIEGINTTNFKNITLAIGHYKGTNTGNNELKIEVSENGTNWLQLNYTRPIGTGTSTWLLIKPEGIIPTTNNLKIKFTNTINSNVGFRIDDILLSGENTLGLTDLTKNELKIYPTIITDGIFNIVSDTNQTKKIALYDINGKLIFTKETHKIINVGKLPKGIYLVRIEENGKSFSQKIIIK